MGAREVQVLQNLAFRTRTPILGCIKMCPIDEAFDAVFGALEASLCAISQNSNSIDQSSLLLFLSHHPPLFNRLILEFFVFNYIMMSIYSWGVILL
jgi:hypothetical protein